ncbi:MAG TPA: Si-specific NAD(P)(+) transhydrogenase [Candidatus Binataceae bacterium]|nr:Si-specific NAD(P)(+) transhydrogenase [Candidatus Binataceae bacterium]
MSNFDFDLAVIGSGPAGHYAAIQGAKLRKRVAVIERNAIIGGVCVNVGTIPSKTMREAILYLSGYREHTTYGDSYRVKERITVPDLLMRVEPVVRHEIDVLRNQLLRNGIELITATAGFVDPHTLLLENKTNGLHKQITAEKIVVAVGTRAIRDTRTPLDSHCVFSSDDVMSLRELPRTLAVVGAGVIGCEYASMFAALGVRVTLIDMRHRLLEFVDSEIVENLVYHLRERRVTLRLGEEVSSIEVFSEGGVERVRTRLASGKQIITDKALLSMGRNGATSELNLTATGLTADSRGRLKTNDLYQTEVDHIYAVGDVIGFPSLASTSREQGRTAVCHAFGVPVSHAPDLFPYGIYTIPEISFVGATEETLTDQSVPYEIGKAVYREVPRGQIIGDVSGMLKLLFHRETRELLGVHIVGDGAIELVHIGQAVLSLKGTVDYFINTVFNYPTLAECYKNAALDGINRLNA